MAPPGGAEVKDRAERETSWAEAQSVREKWGSEGPGNPQGDEVKQGRENFGGYGSLSYEPALPYFLGYQQDIKRGVMLPWALKMPVNCSKK